jgi:DEAD/DEAH box helicase domain-containing protein
MFRNGRKFSFHGKSFFRQDLCVYCALRFVKCPICKRNLVVDSNDEDDVHLYCPECGYLYASKEKRVEKAYLKLLVNHDKKGDEIKKEFKPKTGEAIVRSLDEIRQKVGSFGLVFDQLNNTVLGLLKDRKSYLVEYKFIREQVPEEGSDVSSVIGKDYGNWIEENFFRRFFKFQADAVKKILEGKDIALVAPTGSGKTEAFAIPAFVKASAEANKVGPLNVGRQKTFVLFVYPTKALARDQKVRLGKLAE